jgi:hypothetical protein
MLAGKNKLLNLYGRIILKWTGKIEMVSGLELAESRTGAIGGILSTG